MMCGPTAAEGVLLLDGEQHGDPPGVGGGVQDLALAREAGSLV